jgi:hypothetical protein
MAGCAEAGGLVTASSADRRTRDLKKVLMVYLLGLSSVSPNGAEFIRRNRRKFGRHHSELCQR